MSHTNST